MTTAARVEPVSYTVADATAALGIGKTTLYELIEAGKLRKIKIGKRTLIPASDVRALAEGQVDACTA
jgi:excisionase family DNA binding protein